MRGLSPKTYLVLILLSAAALFLAVAAGSVMLPLSTVLDTLKALISGNELPQSGAIIAHVRLPRVINVFFTGAALSLSGAAMQGLLKNPLADGSTLGVASGASLGAALSLAFGSLLPFSGRLGTAGFAMIFALLSMALVLAFAYRLDCTLSTDTIILTGVVFSMFTNALISMIITFAGEKARSYLFWTMGSLAGTDYTDALILLCALALCGGILLSSGRELDAFSLGEDNARSIGVDVEGVRRRILFAASCLVGITVSIGGCIGFVGLVVPHGVRKVLGPAHEKLLPASLFAGGIFLLLADLVGRTILPPLELPIGVITSLTGSICFMVLLRRGRRMGGC